VRFYNLLEKVYIVTPIVLGLCTIIFCLLVRKLYIEFGWAVFHLVARQNAVPKKKMSLSNDSKVSYSLCIPGVRSPGQLSTHASSRARRARAQAHFLLWHRVLPRREFCRLQRASDAAHMQYLILLTHIKRDVGLLAAQPVATMVIGVRTSARIEMTLRVSLSHSRRVREGGALDRY
jgi:hypothetical protein